jgi:tetratricopeptide (TPR) repeat protein
VHKNTISARFFGIILFWGCLSLFAWAESPREIYERSRTLSSSDAQNLLETNLAGSLEYRPYYLLDLARLSGVKEDWKKSLEWSVKQNLGSVPKDIADAVTYWYAIGLEHDGQTAKSSQLAKTRIDSGNVQDPLVYLAYFRTAASGAEAYIARFDKAFPVLKNTDPDTFALSRYLSGLCAVREGAWAFAVLSFSRFSPLYDRNFPDLAPWSHYYLAYGQYRLGKWPESVASFTVYLDSWKTHAYVWQGASTACLAAIQAGSDPLSFADIAVKSAPSSPDLGSSLLLRASILFDRKMYAESEAALVGVADGSSTRGLTSSAPRAQFMLAEISARLKKTDEAVNRWLYLVSQFPRDPLAEESLYRAGERNYLDGDWTHAAELFSRYRQTWPSGRFLDTVLRLGGESYNRGGNVDLAIIWWEDLISKYPKSQTVMRTYGDLVNVYRQKGEYANALGAAKRYHDKFPTESASDGIDQEIVELNGILKGESADSAALYASYVKANRASSPEGRIVGVRLARQYETDYSKRNDEKAILREITGKSPAKPESVSQNERSAFASAWSMLGNMSREDADFASASKALLSAGKFFATIDGERSAEALYGAADSFLQAGLSSDAKTTVDTMKKSWPDSVWTQRAAILMEQ